MEEDMMSTERI
jgi:hypothetical protein